MDVKPYLDYLDKEMTIMGILSGICIAGPAGILNVALSKDLQGLLWVPGHSFIVVGSVLCVIASLFFYKERSTLAWYYGQICLAEATTTKENATSELTEWLEEADSWATWWSYGVGFTFLIAGFSEYLLAFLFLFLPKYWAWLGTNSHTAKGFALFVCLGAVCVVAPIQYYVRIHYTLSEDAWIDFRNDIFQRFKRGK
jgi:uncharacterized membrane protein YdcZ (DUF606 family)